MNTYQNYGTSPAIRDHPTQLNAPHLHPSQAGRYSIYLSRRDGRLSWLGSLWMNTKTVYPRTNTHLGTNPTRRRVSSLMRPTILPLKPRLQLRFDYDTTTTRLRRKTDMFIFFLLASNRVEWKQARAIIVVGS